MRQVWKYIVDITDGNQNITTPTGAKLVHVGPQGKRIGLWFEVDDQEPLTIIRSFCVFDTGHPIETGMYVGTVIMIPFVWHVYEV